MGETALAVALDANEREHSSPAAYVCPADFMADRSRMHVNYAISNGSKFTIYSGASQWDGTLDSPLRFSLVTDGLSQTAFMAEKLIWLDKPGVGTPAEGKQSPLRFPWLTLAHFEPGEEDQFAAHCLSEAVRTQDLELGSYVGNSLYADSRLYDHLLPPNSWSFTNRNAQPDDGIRYDLSGAAATSMHPVRIFLLRLDGSADLVSSNIDLGIYRALGTINGGETNN